MPQPHYLSKFKTLIPYLPFIKLLVKTRKDCGIGEQVSQL